MLHQLIGPLDWPAAIVIAVMAIGFAVVLVIAMTRPTKHDKDEDRKLKRAEIDNNIEIHKYRAENDYKYKVAQLEQQLITSHREVP